MNLTSQEYHFLNCSGSMVVIKFNGLLAKKRVCLDKSFLFAYKIVLLYAWFISGRSKFQYFLAPVEDENYSIS